MVLVVSVIDVVFINWVCPVKSSTLPNIRCLNAGRFEIHDISFWLPTCLLEGMGCLASYSFHIGYMREVGDASRWRLFR
jgi:hypothetical protein